MPLTHWPADVDDVVRGDLTVVVATLTGAGGVAPAVVAPLGLADQAAGRLGFTTSLAFGKKLERLVAEPCVALAYHAREHGFSDRPLFVLAQGAASVDLRPSRQRLEAFAPQAERYLGKVQRGPLWDRWLREYYAERVFVEVAVERMVVWPDLAAGGEPTVLGPALPGPAAPQDPPARGTAPRVDVARLAGRLAGLPYRLVAWRGGDGRPVVVPVGLGADDASGLHLVAPPGLLAPGGRRAGLVAHAYRAQIVGLASRVATGWLEVGDDGAARYAPHTTSGFSAPPNKHLLLAANGLLSKTGMARARRRGLTERLEAAQAAGQ